MCIPQKPASWTVSQKGLLRSVVVGPFSCPAKMVSKGFVFIKNVLHCYRYLLLIVESNVFDFDLFFLFPGFPPICTLEEYYGCLQNVLGNLRIC